MKGNIFQKKSMRLLFNVITGVVFGGLAVLALALFTFRKVQPESMTNYNQAVGLCALAANILLLLAFDIVGSGGGYYWQEYKIKRGKKIITKEYEKRKKINVVLTVIAFVLGGAGGGLSLTGLEVLKNLPNIEADLMQLTVTAALAFAPSLVFLLYKLCIHFCWHDAVYTFVPAIGCVAAFLLALVLSVVGKSVGEAVYLFVPFGLEIGMFVAVGLYKIIRNATIKGEKTREKDRQDRMEFYRYEHGDFGGTKPDRHGEYNNIGDEDNVTEKGDMSPDELERELRNLNFNDALARYTDMGSRWEHAPEVRVSNGAITVEGRILFTPYKSDGEIENNTGNIVREANTLVNDTRKNVKNMVSDELHKISRKHKIPEYTLNTLINFKIEN